MTLTQDFYLGKYPVTQAEYQAVLEVNPSAFAAIGPNSDRVQGEDTRRFPVEQVSWPDAVKFCEKLTEKEKGTGWVYRLPTEAEWEFACRAGSRAAYGFGDTAGQLRDYAWFNDNAGTHPALPGGHAQTKCLGFARHAWQHLAVVRGLVWEL